MKTSDQYFLLNQSWLAVGMISKEYLVAYFLSAVFAVAFFIVSYTERKDNA